LSPGSAAGGVITTSHPLRRQRCELRRVLDARVAAALASDAEAAGWDGFFVGDHLLFVKRWGIPVGDPWVLLAAAAVATARIVLGPLVTPLPRRRPWNTASAATRPVPASWRTPATRTARSSTSTRSNVSSPPSAQRCSSCATTPQLSNEAMNRLLRELDLEESRLEI
jgi:hypothetical protein